MNENIKIFEEENYLLIVFKKVLFCIFMGLIITFGVSLLFGYKYMVVTSESMTPTLPLYTMVILAPTEYEDLELEDIITFKASKTGVLNFTHRIVEFAEDGSPITAGDANIDSQTGIPKRDGKVSKDVYVGKVVGQILPLGLIVWFVKNHLIQTFVVLLAGFIMYLVKP